MLEQDSIGRLSISRYSELFDIIKNNDDKNIQDYLNNLEYVLNVFTERINDAGWTFPTHATVELIEILGNGKDKTDLDLLFNLYFLGHNSFVFNMMNNKILNSSLDIRFLKAYKECIFAFENDKFIITANTLISIIEGILSNYNTNKNSTHMISLCKKQAEREWKENIIEKFMWISYRNFITKLFENSSFDGEEPSFINRNWLLHGRSSFSLDKIDCLRLFNAVSTMCWINDKSVK